MRPLALALAQSLALSILLACGDSPTASSDGPTDVAVAFCRGLEPAWLAFQDGDGAWAQASPTVEGRLVTFHGSFAASRGAVAVASLLQNGMTALSVQYGAPAELPIVGDARPEHCGPAESTTLLGTVAGVGADEVATVSAGFASRDVASSADGGRFVLRGLIPGPQEILATRLARVEGADVLTGVILRRTPELPDGATLPVLDFASSEAFQPAVGSVTVEGLAPGGGAILHTGLRTAHGETVVTFLAADAAAPTRPYYAIPESRLEPGELQRLSATTAPSTGGLTRAATAYFHAPTNRTLTLGPDAAPPALGVVASAPTLRLRARFPRQAAYDRLTVVVYQQGQRALVSVGMTDAYARLTGGAYDLSVPELTGVPGFDPRWALRPDAEVLWTADRVGGTLGVGLNAVPMDGATSRVGVASGTFTP